MKRVKIYKILLILLLLTPSLSKTEEKKYFNVSKALEMLEENTLDDLYNSVDCIKFTKSDAKIIEKNDIFHQWSWKVEFRNNCPVDIQGYPYFEFFDNDKFLIKKSKGSLILIPSQSEKAFSEIELINVGLSNQINNYRAGITNLRQLR